MAQEIDLGGAIYISSKKAAEITGYAQDYVGQLARSGAIDAQRISGLWYISEESIRDHKEKSEERVQEPPKSKNVKKENTTAIYFEGEEYISATRASKLSGYSGDYVGQLARSGQISARQVGNRWFVGQESLLRHKKEKDALLAGVQAEAVGLRPKPFLEGGLDVSNVSEEGKTHFTYISESFSAEKKEETATFSITEKMESNERGGVGDIIEPQILDKGQMLEQGRVIPIRVVNDLKTQKTPQEEQELDWLEEGEVPQKSVQARKSSHIMMGAAASVLGAIVVVSGIGIAGYIGVNYMAKNIDISSFKALINIKHDFLTKELLYIRARN